MISLLLLGWIRVFVISILTVCMKYSAVHYNLPGLRLQDII